MRSVNRILVSALAVALMLLASAREARADWWKPGVNVFYSSDLPPDAAPYLAWRLSSAFTGGLADFLFEVLVLRGDLKDTGRVPDELLADINFSGISGYQKRFYWHIKDALTREGNRLAKELAAPNFKVRVDLIAATPKLPGCASPRCESFNFGKILPLIVPKAYADNVAKDWILQKLYDTLASFQIAAVLAPSAEEAKKLKGNAVTGLFHYEVSCTKEGGCTASGG